MIRWQEEIQLLAEEMRRSVEFLNWKATWWTSLVGKRAVGNDLDAGLQAYALRQATQFHALASKFTLLWEPLLSISVLDTANFRKRRIHSKSLSRQQ